ncbi:histidine phosphatase family protein [Microbacterium awajiense]|uniref:Histidine phosphatase family protein n=1 Tax=Microbacterium awajiense TaxID=415214 RepID=A0ABP7A3M3_9MICO
MTTLFLVRHGETDWNRGGRIQGSVDIPLNDEGRAQARDAAVRLRTMLEGRTPVVASSDLSRARESAQIIAREFDVDVAGPYPDLRERAYGRAEGMDVDEFRAQWGPWRSAEIPGAETWPQLRHRALRGIRGAVRDARSRHAPVDVPIVVVSHGALIREVIRHASGGERPHEDERLPNGSIVSILVERERLRVLSWADALADPVAR